MLYAILGYDFEQAVMNWSEEQDSALMVHHQGIEQRLAREGKIGPVVRLLPTTTATTVRSARERIVIDGPFAETKEQLLGFFVVECASLEEAIAIASELSHETGAMEIRPIQYFSDRSNPDGAARTSLQRSGALATRDVP